MFINSIRHFLKFQNSSSIMNTRSKLNLKSLKTASKDSPKTDTTEANGEITSKYFTSEAPSPRKTRGVVKKRRSIEVKYEDTKEIKRAVSFEENSIFPKVNDKDIEKPQKEANSQPSSSVKEEKPVKKSGKPGRKVIQELEKVTRADKLNETDVNKSSEDQENVLVSKWTPENWEETFELIKEMRKGHTAPVDDLGCHKCSDKDASPPIYRFQCLLALMLSSQTKDQVTHAAMERLKQHGCTPTSLLATSDDVMEKLIFPVGFYKRKVQYIKKTSEILLRDYNGDIPDTIDGLCALPGVGPKMGHICMQVAWNKVTGIGVDTHVHRICNRLKWVKKNAKTPEETRKQLEDWLPQELWIEINHLLVGFGQEICLPQHPKCGECLNRNLCPYANENKGKLSVHK